MLLFTSPRRDLKLGLFAPRALDVKIGSLSIVGVGFVKIPPQFYEKGPFYV